MNLEVLQFLRSIFVNNRRNNQGSKIEIDSFEWKKFEQQENFLEERGEFNLTSQIYKGHLIIRKKNYFPPYNETLFSWDIDNNSLSAFLVRDTELHEIYPNFIVYKDVLLAFGKHEKEFCMVTMNLEEVGLSIPDTPEKNHLRSIFMSQEGSDVMFKIGDQVIPAHKNLLIDKSEYFANLFESGMIESIQQTIEIKAWEFPIFREFLRFLYYQEVQFETDDDGSHATKLLAAADFYLQSELENKCLDFLKYSINPQNVYTILDIACQRNIPSLQDWCVKFLKSSFTIENIYQFVKYFSEQNKEFLKAHPDLEYKAKDFIKKNYYNISYENLYGLCADFLNENKKTVTIGKIENFLKSDWTYKTNMFNFEEDSDESPKTFRYPKEKKISFYQELQLNLRERKEPVGSLKDLFIKEKPEMKKVKQDLNQNRYGNGSTLFITKPKK